LVTVQLLDEINNTESPIGDPRGHGGVVFE